MASQEQKASAEHKLQVADENHKRTKRVQRAQWLRAAILGANDGLLSTTSLMLGIGAVKEDRWSMVLSGLAGALAGACSMAVGEFVSVSTQRDIEKSVRQSTSKALPPEDGYEIKLELNLGTSSALPSLEKASPLSSGRSPVMKVIAEEAKANSIEADNNEDESLPNPYKAAAASALAFLLGSFVPLLVAILVAQNMTRIVLIVVVSSIGLALSGAIGAHLGGSSVKVSAVRVLIGGWMAMAVTYGLLKPFDKEVDSSRDD